MDSRPIPPVENIVAAPCNPPPPDIDFLRAAYASGESILGVAPGAIRPQLNELDKRFSQHSSEAIAVLQAMRSAFGVGAFTEVELKSAQERIHKTYSTLASSFGKLAVRSGYGPVLPSYETIWEEMTETERTWHAYTGKSRPLDPRFWSKLTLFFSSTQLSEFLDDFEDDPYVGPYEVQCAVRQHADPKAALKAQSALFKELVIEFANDPYAGTAEIKQAIQASASPRETLVAKSELYQTLTEEFKNDPYAGPAEIKQAIWANKDPRAALRRKSRLYTKLMEEFANDPYANRYEVRLAVRKHSKPRAVLRARSKIYHSLLKEFQNNSYANPNEIRRAAAQSTQPESVLRRKSALYDQAIKRHPELSPAVVRTIVRDKTMDPERFFTEFDTLIAAAETFSNTHNVSLNFALWTIKDGSDEYATQRLLHYLNFKNLRYPLELDRPCQNGRNRHEMIAEPSGHSDSLAVARIAKIAREAQLTESELEFLMLAIGDEDSEAAADLLQLAPQAVAEKTEQLLSRLKRAA